MPGFDPRFVDLVNHWFEQCEQLLEDESLEENTRDLVESYMVFFSFNSMSDALLRETQTVIEITKNSKGQVLGVKIDDGKTPPEGS